MRAAALFHDLGRVSVPNGIWEKPGPLTVGEWERVRLHSYYTERVLAAADVFDAMTHDRPHRDALGAGRARDELGAMVGAGRIDKRAADAVLEAARAAPTEARQGYPAGLTDREIEVLRLLAKGKTNREIAAALVIAEKTAGHHVEHIYAKADVSTRVGAALFAMRHDLVD